MTDDQKKQISTAFPHMEFLFDEPIARYTYMKVGGDAALFVRVRERPDLQKLAQYVIRKKIPYIIFGGASNCIFDDRGFDGLVIQNATSTIAFDDTHVTADSGVTTAVLSKQTADKGLAGLAHFVGVPGTIGGAMYNNAHFTSSECIGDFVQEVEIINEKGDVEVLAREDLEFAYDASVFHKRPVVIMAVLFALKREDPQKIQEQILLCAQKRAHSQPIGIPSTGCMFQNPLLRAEDFALLSQKTTIPADAVRTVGERYRIAAGFLIDQAGLKKMTIGGAQVSETHATFIINTGSATAHDVEMLTQRVQDVVKQKFGISLQREVFFLPSS